LDELIQKAKSGDNDAFDSLILKIEKELYLIAKSKLLNDDDIADVIQDTILSIYKNIHKLRDTSLFKTWAIKILLNKCNKHYKKVKNNISLEDSEVENYIGYEQNYNENVNFDLLISNLNSDEKLILTLYYYSGYTVKEISKIIRKNENTVKSKLFRTKEKLKSFLKEIDLDERYWKDITRLCKK